MAADAIAERKRAAIIGAAVVLALIATGIFFYLRAIKVETFRATLRQAESSHLRGNWDMAEQKFKEALALAPSRDEGTRTKWLLAISLMRPDASGSGREEAVRLFKEIIADPAVSAQSRALALNRLAFAYDLSISGDEAFVRRAIFSEEPYATYVREADGDIRGALRRIFEQSDALYPTAFAKFEIAFKYATALHRGRVEAGLDARQTAERIQEYVYAARPLLGAIPYETSTVAFMHLMEAFSLGVSETVLRNIDFSDIEAAYRQAVATARRAPAEDIYAKPVLLRIYPHYAGDLLARFGEMRVSDVRELLLAYLELKSIGLADFARGVQRKPENDPMRTRFIEFARVSSEFRSFLVDEAGWQL